MKKKSNFWYDFTKITAAIPILIWLRPKTIYMGKGKMPKMDGMMVCANHGGFVDPIRMQCTFWRTRVSILATTELYSTKLKSLFFTKMNCIPVDKDNFSMNSVHEVCDEIKAGKTIVIFPEGRVNRTGEDLIEFKSGIILMASLADAAIVPTYIVPVKKWYDRRLSVVGEPIPVRSICSKYPSMQEMDKACMIIRDKVSELKEMYFKEEEREYNDRKQCV